MIAADVPNHTHKKTLSKLLFETAIANNNLMPN